ncbi:MAG TPA: RDD family protein [Bacillota bacterium]|nr:RDD family protein [Bacillota bacterium]
MNKKDFLNELANALEGKLPEADIREITSDYGDIFDNGAAEGKSEEDIAQEIGSPVKIARTILEDGPEKREYTGFQKNINEQISKITEPDRRVEIGTLAPMTRRLGAYIIDCLAIGVIVIILGFILMIPLSFAHRWGRFGFTNLLLMSLLFGVLNLFTTIFLWATNGYTPGKWLLQMRVVKINGGKVGFLDAVLRELLIKGIANSILSGILNIISFLWGCLTEDHKTIHDLAAQTRVVEWDRTKRAASEPFNPLES